MQKIFFRQKMIFFSQKTVRYRSSVHFLQKKNFSVSFLTLIKKNIFGEIFSKNDMSELVDEYWDSSPENYLFEISIKN